MTSKQRRGWHVGREVPVAVLAGLALQTISFVVWITMLAAKVETQGRKLVEIGSQFSVISTAVSASAAPMAVTAVEIAAIKAQIIELRARIELVQSSRGAR